MLSMQKETNPQRRPTLRKETPEIVQQYIQLEEEIQGIQNQLSMKQKQRSDLEKLLFEDLDVGEYSFKGGYIVTIKKSEDYVCTISIRKVKVIES